MPDNRVSVYATLGTWPMQRVKARYTISIKFLSCFDAKSVARRRPLTNSISGSLSSIRLEFFGARFRQSAEGRKKYNVSAEISMMKNHVPDSYRLLSNRHSMRKRPE